MKNKISSLEKKTGCACRINAKIIAEMVASTVFRFCVEMRLIIFGKGGQKVRTVR